MSDTNSSNSTALSQLLAEVVSITADVRLQKGSLRKAQAFADVIISFRRCGSITIHGFSVVQEDGKPPVVLPPARKGEHRYFAVLSLSGEIRRSVEQVVLDEYEHLREHSD